MTLQQTRIKKAGYARVGTICLMLLSLFSFTLLLRRADVATACMREGLSLCARAVVPSLFPFLVLSELLVASGAGEVLTLPLQRPLRWLLGFSPAGCCAAVLGLLCGFPTGARCALLSYEKGSMDRAECERVLACCSIPSSAFLISTVGVNLWQDMRFGILLFISALAAALFCGILLHVLQKRRIRAPRSSQKSAPVRIRFDATMLTSAVKSATASTLLICAYIVFFTTLTGAVGLVLGRFGASDTVEAALAAFLELSGGISAAAVLEGEWLAVLLTGAAVGWSGLSVHCQMLSVCDGHDIDTRPYWIAKLLQAILCPLLLLPLWCIFRS